VSGSYRSVVLEAVGVNSYSELMALDVDEVVRLMDERKAPLHPGDAFLAVLVLKAVSDLTETSRALDRARKGFERATLVLALVAVAVGVGQLVAAL
jgi:hypothetical protein